MRGGGRSPLKSGPHSIFLGKGGFGNHNVGLTDALGLYQLLAGLVPADGSGFPNLDGPEMYVPDQIRTSYGDDNNTGSTGGGPSGQGAYGYGSDSTGGDTGQVGSGGGGAIFVAPQGEYGADGNLTGDFDGVIGSLATEQMEQFWIALTSWSSPSAGGSYWNGSGWSTFGGTVAGADDDPETPFNDVDGDGDWSTVTVYADVPLDGNHLGGASSPGSGGAGGQTGLGNQGYSTNGSDVNLGGMPGSADGTGDTEEGNNTCTVGDANFIQDAKAFAAASSSWLIFNSPSLLRRGVHHAGPKDGKGPSKLQQIISANQVRNLANEVPESPGPATGFLGPSAESEGVYGDTLLVAPPSFVPLQNLGMSIVNELWSVRESLQEQYGENAGPAVKDVSSAIRIIKTGLEASYTAAGTGQPAKSEEINAQVWQYLYEIGAIDKWGDRVENGMQPFINKAINNAGLTGTDPSEGVGTDWDVVEGEGPFTTRNMVFGSDFKKGDGDPPDLTPPAPGSKGYTKSGFLSAYAEEVAHVIENGPSNGEGPPPFAVTPEQEFAVIIEGLLWHWLETHDENGDPEPFGGYHPTAHDLAGLVDSANSAIEDDPPQFGNQYAGNSTLDQRYPRYVAAKATLAVFREGASIHRNPVMEAMVAFVEHLLRTQYEALDAMEAAQGSPSEQTSFRLRNSVEAYASAQSCWNALLPLMDAAGYL